MTLTAIFRQSSFYYVQWQGINYSAFLSLIYRGNQASPLEIESENAYFLK